MATVIHKEGSGGGAGNVMLAFILGAVLIAAGVIGFFMWDDYKSGGGGASKDITINMPEAPKTPAPANN